MIRVIRNGITLSVHSWSDYLTYVEFQDRESWKKIQAGQMPDESTSDGLLLYPGLPFHQRARQMIIMWPAYDPSRDVLLFTGYNPQKIDYAVPQGWWDDFYKQHGVPPRAFWSYERGGVFGEPLFYSTVHAELRRLVQMVVWHRTDELLSGISAQDNAPIEVTPLETLYVDKLKAQSSQSITRSAAGPGG